MISRSLACDHLEKTGKKGGPKAPRMQVHFTCHYVFQHPAPPRFLEFCEGTLLLLPFIVLTLCTQLVRCRY